MKAFKFTPFRSIYILFSFLATATAALALAPIINPNFDTATTELGQSFPDPLDPLVAYQIVTDTDGTSEAPVLYNARGLPEGLSCDPLTGEITGATTESSATPFIVTLTATNETGTGTGTLELTVNDPAIGITSPLAIAVAAGESYTYTITANNDPISFSVLGLSVMATDATIPIDSLTGSFSFTPSVSGVGDTISLLIRASNASSTKSAILEVTILPTSFDLQTPATVVVDAPLAASVVDPLVSTTIDVSATVNPDAGETLDSVFVRWNNPPRKPDGTARSPIILTSLNGPATGGVFTGTINIGFDPDNRELGGGNIDLEVVAYQNNGVNTDNFGSDSVSITVKPLLEVLFPDDELERSNFALGDIFTSARVSTSNFGQVSARISGPGIIESVVDLSSNRNGVYNFITTQAIAYAGTYDLEVEALDGSGLSTLIERKLIITETLTDPVAIVVTPTRGFTNEVFSAAVVSFNRESSTNVTNDDGDIIGYDITYRLSLVSGGQGYYPRNNTGVVIPGTNSQGLTRGISGISVSNGRIVSVPETAVGYTAVGDPSFGNSGNLIMDNPNDSGVGARIQIAAQFFKADASLVSYKLFVNGEDVTPGIGNLDTTGTIPIDVAAIDFPPNGSPQLGDYVVTAQVFDADGKVGDSSPISFQILPYEPLEILLSRQVTAGNAASDPIIIGGSATFLADVAPIDEIESVKFFESLSGDELGDGSRVQISGQEFYRCSIVFPEAGDFKVFAVATAFSGQTANSAPVDITVESGEFPVVEITAPSSGDEVPSGLNLEILIDADDPDPDGQITKVEVFNGSESLGVATQTGIEDQYRLNLTPSAADAGVINLIARATDDRGNSTDSAVVPIGVVLGAVPQVEILSPTPGTEFFVGQPFEIRARATDSSPGGSITSVTLTDINFFTRIQGVNGTILVISDSLSFSEDTMSQSSTPGEYVFIATINSPDVVDLVVRASDNAGNVTATAPLQFTITNGVIPDVAITTTLAGATYSPGDTVTIDITSSDADGSVTQVEVFNGSTSLGLADFVSNGNYRFNYVTSGVGIVNLSARSTDNIGNVAVSNVETISVAYPPFSVGFTSPTASPYEIEGTTSESFSATRSFTVEIEGIDASNLASLDWQLDDGSAALSQTLVGGSLTYSQAFEFSDTTILTVTATDVYGISVQNSLTVFVDLPDPGAGDLTDFINYIYNQFRGSAASAVELQVAIDAINALGGDTPANRAAFAAPLFTPNVDYGNSQSQTVALVYKTLTGQWPTQTQLETGLSIISQDTTVQSSQTVSTQEGSITAGGTQTLSFNYSQGDQVTITVTSDGTNANPLTDATLTIRAPDGSFVGYSDDNFLSGNFSLDPVVSFVASQTGAHTATVGGYFPSLSGDFVGTSATTAIESNIDTLAARALVESVKGSYNGANGFLADADAGSFNLSPAFVAQIYLNKHGVDIASWNSTMLGERMAGIDENIGNGYILPGYQGNVVNFVADFALDVDLATGLLATSVHPDGYPYSGALYYGRPNDPLPSWDQARVELQSDANLGFALSALLGMQNPTATDLADYEGMTLKEALAEIFGSAGFAAQFVGDTASADTDGDGFTNYDEVLLGTDPDDDSVAPTAVDFNVSQIMLNLGIVDGDKVAANDDADGDGVSNYIEILLNADPSISSDAPTAEDSFVAQRMVNLGVVDPNTVASDDDADGDGVSNIAEILLNTDPSLVASAPTSGQASTEVIDTVTYFVLEFVRLKPSLTPSGLSVVLESADETLTFAPVANLESNLSQSADQDGITSDYERVEIRVDASSIDSSFFRLSVQ